MFFQPKHWEPNACAEMLFLILSAIFTDLKVHTQCHCFYSPKQLRSQFRFAPCNQLSTLSSFSEWAIGGWVGEYSHFFLIHRAICMKLLKWLWMRLKSVTALYPAPCPPSTNNKSKVLEMIEEEGEPGWPKILQSNTERSSNFMDLQHLKPAL